MFQPVTQSRVAGRRCGWTSTVYLMNAVFGNRRASLYELKQRMESLVTAVLGAPTFDTISTESGANVVTLFANQYDVSGSTFR